MRDFSKKSETKKMNELSIFKNKTPLGNNMMLHQDDMSVYSSWLLVEYHNVDEVLYRGPSDNIWKITPPIPNLVESISKIGNPKNIIITSSKQDTY